MKLSSLAAVANVLGLKVELVEHVRQAEQGWFGRRCEPGRCPAHSQPNIDAEEKIAPKSAPAE